MNALVQWEMGALTQRRAFRPFTTSLGLSADDPPVSTFVDPQASALDAFFDAVREAVDQAVAMADEGEIAPPNAQTYQFAIVSLAPLAHVFALPAPLLLPLQDGGIGAEWHDHGLNVELRFRAPYDVYAVIEDADAIVDELHGRDNDLKKAQLALAELSHRARA